MLSHLMILLKINATDLVYFCYPLVSYCCTVVIIFEMRVEKDNIASYLCLS